MIKELEVKVLNINKEEIENKLINLGAKLIKKEYQINTIFDSSDRMIKNAINGYLRIRESRDLLKNESKYIFTLKKNISKEGLRENIEIETEIENEIALTEILQYLNFDIKHKGTKDRISYIYENIRFDIDTWDNDTYPYPYLEIEVTDKKDLDKAIRLLDLNKNDVTSKSLGQLRMEIGFTDL